MDMEEDLSSPVQRHGGRHPLPDQKEFIVKLERLGMSNQSKVVLYDDDMASAPRLWWMLKHIGVDEVKLLNGGYRAWLQKGFPTESTVETAASTGKIVPQLTAYRAVDIDFIRKVLSGEIQDVILVDSRSPERYAGLLEPIDKVAGRIPGAVNRFFMDAFEDNYIKTPAELEKFYALLDRKKQIVVYCGSGVTASANIAAMEEVGIRSVLYLGSYSDYISYEDNPVQKDS